MNFVGWAEQRNANDTDLYSFPYRGGISTSALEHVLLRFRQFVFYLHLIIRWMSIFS